ALFFFDGEGDRGRFAAGGGGFGVGFGRQGLLLRGGVRVFWCFGLRHGASSFASGAGGPCFPSCGARRMKNTGWRFLEARRFKGFSGGRERSRPGLDGFVWGARWGGEGRAVPCWRAGDVERGGAHQGGGQARWGRGRGARGEGVW